MSLSCSTVDPNTVYLMSSNQQLILKTVDGGANWTNLTSAFNAAQNSYNWSQSWYDYHVHTSSRLINGVPTDVVYIGLIDVMMSDDAGTSWRSVGGVNNNPTYSNSAILHNDQHSFAINPQNPLEVMAGNDGGVYSGVYNAGTRNVDWTPLSKTLGITQFYTFAMFPSNKDYIMGGTQDNASPHSFADLQNWDNVTGGDGGGCVIDYNNINLQYGESQYHGLVKTSNHWNSSTSFAPSFSGQSVPFIGDMWIDPNNPDYIYVNTNYLDRYQNSTNTWSYLSNSSGTPLMSSGIVNAVAIPVGDSTRIYAGGTSGQLWMSTNFGTSWVRIDDMGGANGLPNKGITSISLDPNNKNSLLVSYSGGGTNHLYRCLDVNAASRVWTNVSGSGSNALPSVSLNSVVRDPFEPLTVWYAGTDVGVFQTLDGGANWTDITVPRGLPNVEVSKLYMNTQFNLLYASTYGRGMWRIAVDSGLAQSLDATPSVVTQGDIVNFTLHLTRPVTSNTVFTLTQSNGSALSIPATVTVTTGNDSVSFSGTAQTLASTVVDTVTATDSTGSHASANVEVRALVVDYANAVTFTNASSIVGTVNDLHVSDDVYQSWRFAVANQNGSIAEYTGHCDVQNPLKLTVRIEEAGDYTTLQREVALYDFQAGSYVVLGGNFLTTTDLTRDFVAGGSIARFLDANGNFKLRYSVVRPRNIRGFGNRIDLLEFRFQ